MGTSTGVKGSPRLLVGLVAGKPKLSCPVRTQNHKMGCFGTWTKNGPTQGNEKVTKDCKRAPQTEKPKGHIRETKGGKENNPFWGHRFRFCDEPKPGCMPYPNPGGAGPRAGAAVYASVLDLWDVRFAKLVSRDRDLSYNLFLSPPFSRTLLLSCNPGG